VSFTEQIKRRHRIHNGARTIAIIAANWINRDPAAIPIYERINDGGIIAGQKNTGIDYAQHSIQRREISLQRWQATVASIGASDVNADHFILPVPFHELSYEPIHFSRGTNDLVEPIKIVPEISVSQ
jgi:hypothetical protein